MLTICSHEELDTLIRNKKAVLIYFSHDQCNVCKVLKPKTEQFISQKFPLIQMAYSDTVQYPAVSAGLSVFVVPTVIIWFEGRETFRFSRNIGLGELESAIQRPYSIIFED